MKKIYHLLLIGFITGSANAQCFSTFSNTYPVQSSPRGLAIADFNNDGKLDVVVLSTSNNVFQLFKNTGNGYFTETAIYNTGNYPSSIEAYDLNGDGYPDISYTRTDSSLLCIRFNNGDGTFGPRVSYPSGGNYPLFHKIADVNGDSLPDIIVSNQLSGNISVLLNNGSGGFLPAVNTSVGGGNSNSISVKDVNGDNFPDVAVDVGGGVVILINNGNGTFMVPVYYGASAGSTSMVILGDVNNDGHADLVQAIAGQPGFIDVHLNNGSGVFSAPTSYQCDSVTEFIGLADLNNDGYPDLVASGIYSQTIDILMNNGNGTFAPQIDCSGGVVATAIGFGDFNGDSFLDIALGNNGNNTLGILLNNGNGTFGNNSNVYNTGTSPRSIATGDLNGDGFKDMAVVNYTTHNVSIIMNNGNGTFAPALSYTVGANPQSIAIGDVNGDTYPDIAVVGYHFVSILINSGNGTFSSPVNYSIPSYGNAVLLEDLNGDNFPDLAIADSTLSILLNTGTGTFGTPVFYNVGSFPISLALGNLNNDGFPDLAVANNTSQTISLLTNSGTGTFGAATTISLTGAPTSIAIADINVDGYNDIAVTSGNNVCRLLNSGTGSFVSPIYYAVGTNPYFIALKDITGDGYPDLFVANEFSGTVSIKINSGSGTFPGFMTNYTAGTNPCSLSITDLNGDGSSDIAVVNKGSNNVMVFFNYTAAITSTCLGSNFVLHAQIGGSNYLWSPGGSTADSLEVNTSGTYTLTMSDPLVTCTGNTSITVATPCAADIPYVWPGDTDNNNVVDNFDLLPIGLYYSQIGFTRIIQNNLWQADSSLSWGFSETNGADIKHADCNGDGMIDNNDTLAVNLNFSSTHAVAPYSNGLRTINPDLYFSSSTNSYLPGSFINVDIMLGTSTLPVNNMYGIAFNINYDASLVQTGTESLTYPDSWLGTPWTDAIKIAKVDELASTAYGAETRITHTNANGYGEIATFRFQAKNTITTATPMNFSFTGYAANDSVGNPIIFNLLPYSIIIDPLTVGVMNHNGNSVVSIYPNPFTEQTTIMFDKEQKNTMIKVLDVMGREIMSFDKLRMTKEFVLDMTGVAKGIYFVRIEDENKNVVNRKVVVQ